MLMLKRKENEVIRLFVPPSDKPQAIEIVVTEADRRSAKIGITAAKEVVILRGEVESKP